MSQSWMITGYAWVVGISVWLVSVYGMHMVG